MKKDKLLHFKSLQMHYASKMAQDFFSSKTKFLVARKKKSRQEKNDYVKKNFLGIRDHFCGRCQFL